MDNNYTFDWDSEINNEDSGFVLLPEGDYEFTVDKFERGTFDGSDKLPPCKKAIVTFTIYGENDNTTVTENFLLCGALEWKLSSLFLSVRMKKHGEPLRMNWNGLVGQKGHCHIYVDKYQKKNSVPEKKKRKNYFMIFLRQNEENNLKLFSFIIHKCYNIKRQKV